MESETFFDVSQEQGHLDLTIDAIDRYLEELPTRLAATEHAAAYKIFERTAAEYAYFRPQPIIGVLAEKNPTNDEYVFTRIGKYPISGLGQDVLVAGYESEIGRKWVQIERLDDDSIFGATITIADGRVLSIAETNAQRASVRRERIRRLKDGSLHDIMDTIDPDQDDIVRMDHQGCLVIEGGPGTGKTAVALHRLAYLVRSNQGKIFDDSNVLVIGPTSAYSNYVKDFLPLLGISGVSTESFSSLCLKRIPNKDLPDFTELREERDQFKLTKNSAGIFRVIQECLWPPVLRLNIEATVDRGIAGTLKRNIDSDDISAMLSRLYQKFMNGDLSYNQARSSLHREIQNLLITEAGIQGAKSARTVDARREELLDKWLLRIGLFSQQERLNWKRLLDSPRGGRYKRGMAAIMADFYQSDIENAIEVVAESQKIDIDALRTQLLNQGAPRKGRGSTVPDSENDEDVELITLNEISFSDFDRARSGSQLTVISQIVDRLLPSRDGVRMARLVCKGDTKLFERVLGPNGRNTASRLAEEARNVANGKRVYVWSDADLPIVAEIMYLLDGNSGRQNFSHVLVDEAQDLTRMQCKVVSQFVTAGQLTLVGDMNQATRTGNLGSWENLVEEFVAENPITMSLLQNYRVPQNIYDYARQYLTENDRIDTPTCDIEGGKVTLLEVGQSEALQILEETVVSLVKIGGRIAVITESNLFRESVENMNLENVVALTPEESKGLEVDHSVLIQPNRWYKDSGRLRNLMYVTLTRATKSVTIIQHEPERFGIIGPQLVEA